MTEAVLIMLLLLLILREMCSGAAGWGLGLAQRLLPAYLHRKGPPMAGLSIWQKPY